MKAAPAVTVGAGKVAKSRFGVKAAPAITADFGGLADLERVAALLCMTSGVGTSVSVVGAMVLTAKVAKSCQVSSAG